MNERTLTDMVMTLPEIGALPGDVGQKKSAIGGFIPSALNEVVMSHDWDFACDEADYPSGSVEDQADYRLEGNKEDCRDIINVKYGDDYNLLDMMTPVDLDEYMLNRSVTGVGIWVPIERDRGFPQITLVDTPDADGDNIRYRYRRKNIRLGEFPDEWGFVLVSAIVKRLYPAYMPVFEKDLKRMKDRYDAVGGEDRPAKLDPMTITRNNSRWRLHGWS